ncbi:uncharacterized protein Z518_06441 [Rhinocladiella mackenziei CBS 650.93]|uniref:AB hydrolase-1 domain-containing protein n=1 Tax=Rhinocladiella mackenziei CBS 650.93 TaxID=1442369 RepID=A0A0D2IIK7_9EURO|nr:uncharacterized protein Z518_06441 [Rhinocladiella mackenziei CBS 650.93]KIX05569.1 hypothetical protein Z518_06441 [Rhinocladiella mackenziei CBS 650.93]
MKPTLLFVPGAWHSPAHYDRIIELLSEYPCEIVTLATVGPIDPANTDADTDVEIISKAIDQILSQGNDIVLIAHSYGGIPALSAAYSFVDRKPGIKAIALMASFLYPPQTSLIMPLGNQPAPFHKIEGDLVHVGDPGPEVLFYNDLSSEEASRWTKILKPHSWRSKEKPPSSEGVGWWFIPTSYLVCENDNAIPAPFQRKMISDANEAYVARGSNWKIREEVVDSGHSPFLSMPDQAADFIRRTTG